MANQIIQSIKTIAQSLVDDAGYDKTRGGLIVGVNQVTNTYSVKVDGITYPTVRAVDDATYNVGDIVKVVIPCNQATQMYISASILSDNSLGNKVANATTLAGDAKQLGLDNQVEIQEVSEVANSKNKTFRQATEPVVGMSKGDIWIDIDDENKMYIYDGTQWLFSGGGDGQDGLNNATVLLYQRGATAPTRPIAELTYTFADASLSPTSALNGWTQNIPTTDGNPCWVIAATASATTATDTIGASEWSTQTKFVEDGVNGKMLYGTCNTTANTTDKVVVCSEATSLYAGLTIIVKFSTANTVLAPTLNVNSLGAKNIWVDNAKVDTSNCLFWNTNALITFTYDGTQWLVVDQPSSYYVACTTAADTVAKVATVASSVVRKGTTATVTFTYAHNSASNATLYITGTSINANRTVYVNGTVVNNTNGNSWSAGESVTFVFNGQYWYAAMEPKGNVEISIQTISYPNQTATLKAILFVNGKVVTPTSYQWSYGDAPTAISGATSQTINITAATAGGLGLKAKYNCAVTW